MLVRWDEKYRVGNQEIDSEHQFLFQLINDFYDAFVEKRDRTQVLTLLNRLVEYAEKHFTHEEALMAEAGYPDREAHLAHHVKLYEQIFELNARFNDRAHNPAHETVLFLKAWLADHIVHQDLLLGAHLKSRPPAA
jgi:hemerythrin